MPISEKTLMVRAVEEAVDLLHPFASAKIAHLITKDRPVDEFLAWFAQRGDPCPGPEHPPYRPGTRPECGHYSGRLGCKTEAILRAEIKVARIKYATLLRNTKCLDISITWTIPAGQDCRMFLAEKEEVDAIRRIYNLRYSDIGWSPHSQEVGFNVVLSVSELKALQKLSPNFPAIYRENIHWSLAENPMAEPKQRRENVEPGRLVVQREYPGELPEMAEFLGPPIHRAVENWYVYSTVIDPKPSSTRRIPQERTHPLFNYRMPADVNDNSGVLQRLLHIDYNLSRRLSNGEEVKNKPTKNPQVITHQAPAIDGVDGAADNRMDNAQALASVHNDAHFTRLKKLAAARHKGQAPRIPQAHSSIAEQATTNGPSRPALTRRFSRDSQRRYAPARHAAVPQLKRRATTQVVMQRRRPRSTSSRHSDLEPVCEDSGSLSDDVAVASGPRNLQAMDFKAAKAMIRSQLDKEAACRLELPESPQTPSIPQPSATSIGTQLSLIHSMILSSIMQATGAESELTDSGFLDGSGTTGHSAKNSCEKRVRIRSPRSPPATPSNKLHPHKRSESESSADSAGSPFWSPQKQSAAEIASSIATTPRGASSALSLTKASAASSPSNSLRASASTSTQALNASAVSFQHGRSPSDDSSPPMSLAIESVVTLESPSRLRQNLIRIRNFFTHQPDLAASAPLKVEQWDGPSKVPTKTTADLDDPFTTPKLSLLPVFMGSNLQVRTMLEEDSGVDDPVAPSTTQVVSGLVDGEEVTDLVTPAEQASEFTVDRQSRLEDSEEFYTPVARDFGPRRPPLLERRRSIDTIRRQRDGRLRNKDFFWCPIIGASLRRSMDAYLREIGHDRHRKLKRCDSCPN